jgi:hypothetical protein
VLQLTAAANEESVFNFLNNVNELFLFVAVFVQEISFHFRRAKQRPTTTLTTLWCSSVEERKLETEKPHAFSTRPLNADQHQSLAEGPKQAWSKNSREVQNGEGLFRSSLSISTFFVQTACNVRRADRSEKNSRHQLVSICRKNQFKIVSTTGGCHVLCLLVGSH